MGDRSIASKKDKIVGHFCITEAEIRGNYASITPCGALVFTVDKKWKLHIVGSVEAGGTNNDLSPFNRGSRQ